MRFGYCINMLALPGSDGSGREALPMISRLGFDYVELPLAQMMAYDDSRFEALFVAPLERSGLPCACCNNFLPSSLPVTGLSVDRSAILGYAERAMARAVRLGANKIVFGSAGARNYPCGFPRETAVEQVQTLLCQLEPLADAHGITLVIEHLNRSESNLLNSLGEGVEMVKKLNLPHVRNLLDSYHLMIGNGSLDEIREAGLDLRHVHIARVLGRGLPLPGDETDWKALWAMLNAIGYNGDCSIEAYVSEDHRGEQIGRSLAFLKSL